MENEHDNLIVKLIEQEAEARRREVKGLYKNIEAGFELLATEMSKISEQKKIQNGRVDKLEKVTRLNSFIANNPKASVFLGIVGFYGVSELFSVLSLADMLKKYLPF